MFDRQRADIFLAQMDMEGMLNASRFFREFIEKFIELEEELAKSENRLQEVISDLTDVQIRNQSLEFQLDDAYELIDVLQGDVDERDF